MPKLGIKRVTSGVKRTFLNFRPACKLLTNNDLDPPTSLQTDPNRRPPEAKVSGSNPDVWMTKILTDPFHDIKIYQKAPYYILKGEMYDKMEDWYEDLPLDNKSSGPVR